jgi:hypothetical protein
MSEILNPITFKREDKIWIMRPSVTSIPKIIGNFNRGGGDIGWTVHFMGDVIITTDELEQLAAKLRELEKEPK